MHLVVISPQYERRDEFAVLERLLSAGLQRYHVRKPHATGAELVAWLRRVPPEWRSRLVLHQHHELVADLGLGGRHWKDNDIAVIPPRDVGTGAWTSRSCHDLATLRASLGGFDAVFFAPVFASISKTGHAPSTRLGIADVAAVLRSRVDHEAHTAVFALGGISVATIPQARAWGFDGVAALGAVWTAPDPVEAFLELQLAVHECVPASP